VRTNVPRVVSGCACVWVVLIIGTRGVLAGPQHWGFGFSYLAAIEDTPEGRRLAVYEPPLRAKDGPWACRWLDRTTGFADVASGGAAIGNFWPSSFGREHLVVVTAGEGAVTLRTYEPPEVFAVGPWTLKATSGAVGISGAFLGATAGNLRGLAKDQLVVALGDGGAIRIAILVPPSAPSGTTWTRAAEAALPDVSGEWVGMACGDFWGEDKDYLAVATTVGGAVRIAFYGYNTGTNTFSLVATDAAGDLPVIPRGGLTAADYEKDGFDVVTLVTADGTFELRAAPLKAGQGYSPGPEYTGKAYSGQWMPGSGGAASRVVMRGWFGAPATARLSVAAGRVFGYVSGELNQRFAANPGPDAQIAFMHRTPRKDECGPYGWPAPGQTTTYEIALQNNGSTPIAANSVRLKVWYNRPNRNADTDPATCDAPDFDQMIDEGLAAYDPNAPAYVRRAVSFAWPYGLVPAGPRATWQKLDLEGVGERWVIAVVECAGDVNARNNRYEAAVHGLTFHPIFRSQASLADRQPTVAGDPPSKEYLARKLADAVQCMWERSGTRDGQDVLQRLWFDSYEIGWPDEAADPGRAWQVVQSRYEGWRELDGWWGLNQGWERFNWGDGGGELHETGHLFHPLGDLYQYYVSPVFTGAATMADGTPVQLRTWVWPADSFGSGHTRISWPACEMMRRVLVGVRNAAIMNWETLAPDRTFVRVLDRDGQPVGGAEVKLWTLGSGTPYAVGVTDDEGRWEITSLFGSPTVDSLGRRHYFGAAGLIHSGAQVFTVAIGRDYQDCAVWGAEDTGAHSRHTYMGHSFTDEDSWTWDFRTNYKAGVPAPDFAVAAAVQGVNVSLGVTGPPGATYRVYRRWEPTYIRTAMGEYAAEGATLAISQSLAAADSFGSGRFRATYEVTRVQGDTESLPRVVQVTGLSNGRGLSARPDGRLLVAANAGIANPFCQVFEGTTPYQELFYHFRFGHTANRVVASRAVPGRYYATLSLADMTPEYRFDFVEPQSGGYDVRNDIASAPAKSYTAVAPFTIRCYSVSDAARYNPGDQVSGPAGSAKVTQVSGDTITVDGLIFSGPGQWFSGSRLAGRPGTNAAMRELSSPRGLDVFTQGGREYVAIADTGNRRVVVWTGETAYVTHWQSSDGASRPAGVAAHPAAEGRFFVIDRRSAGASKLYLFAFDGSALSVEPGYPVDVAVNDSADGSEMGLAAATHPRTGAVVLMVTDARLRRVLELTEVGGTWQTTATYTQATGVYAGGANLVRPSDAAFVRTSNSLRWYALDGGNRVVLLNAFSMPVALDASVRTAVNGPVDIALGGESPQGRPLAYTILALPEHGTLIDPWAGPILSAPHTLPESRHVVRYRPATDYRGADGFVFRVSDGEDSNPATVSIQVGGMQAVYVFSMDADPGWRTEGQWAFGRPTGGGGQRGRPDPTSGHTGTNVYGYNLNGDYGAGLPETHLTSGALDCRALVGVSLRFWRWLGVEGPSYDRAYVRVSADGVHWETIWQNTGYVTDAAWTYQEFDISAIADGQPAVYLRWTMGPTDASLNYCGWNIDDVEVWGEPAYPRRDGDLDGDGDADVGDFASFQLCFNGSGRPPAVPGCEGADFDGDGDVDVGDFASFQLCFNGSGRPSACEQAADPE